MTSRQSPRYSVTRSSAKYGCTGGPYHWLALIVIEPMANETVSPLTTPVIAVIAPCSHRSGVPAESQISMPLTVAQVPVADQDTALELDWVPPDGAAQNVVPSVDPPAVYPPVVVSSVPL